MLSYVFRLASDFHRNHGYWPNRLYLNSEHFQHWQDEVGDSDAFAELARRLGMDIVISGDALHPHVAWLPHQQCYAC